LLNQILRKIEKSLLIVVGACAACAALLMLVLLVSEYKPGKIEAIDVTGQKSEKTVSEGDRIELLTFNIGYGGLDESMDSFLDGGAMNTPKSKKQVVENLDGIVKLIGEQSYDVLFLQEVDRDSRRSYHIDESELMSKALGSTGLYAQNLRCLFVPYPFMDVVGKLNSGIQTHTKLNVQSAERIALPAAYGWPKSVFEAKRCMLIARIPVKNSGRELVLVNVQLDAYDDGSSKAVQSQLLMEFMQREYESGNYVIAGGDFNHVFPDDNLKKYPLRAEAYFKPGRLTRDSLEGEWTFASDISTPTRRLLDAPYRSNRWWAQYYVVDGFIMSPNVSLEHVETIDAGFRYSDHNPVKATVRLE